MRLVGVDAARGLALLGMMSVHVLGEESAAQNVFHHVFDGRASALFAVLAGVGIGLANGRETPPEGEALARGRRRIAVRAFVVAFLGLTLGAVDTPAAIILLYYGLLFLVAIPVLGWGPRRLAVAAAAAAVLTPLLSQLLRAAYDVPRFAQNLSWTSLLDPGATLATVVLTGYYPVLTWTTYLLAGLAVGRLALREADVVTRVAVVGAALALAGWLLSGALRAVEDVTTDVTLHGTTPTGSWWWLDVVTPHSGATPDLVHTVGTSLLVLGLMLTLVRVAGPRLVRPLACAGAMTLTLYSVHVVVFGVTSDAFPDADWWLLAAQAIGALVIGTLWNAPARPGPLEAMTAEVGDVVTDPGVRR